MASNFADGSGDELDTGEMREKALKAVNTFKAIKKSIWETCNIWNVVEDKEIPKEQQTVNLEKLRILLEEIKFLLESHRDGMTIGLT